MSYSLLTMVPWILVSIIVTALNVISAVVLLRERHLGAWLMLAGSATYLLGQFGSFVVQIAFMTGNRLAVGNMQFMMAFPAVSALGSLLFAVGVLLHALHQRAKANRITELEAIIASLQNR